jgi:type IV pilus assembly protein PilN
MIRINLLSEGRRPSAVRKSRVDLGDRNWSHVAVVVLVVLAAIGTVGYWWHLSRVRAGVREEVKVAEAEVERLRPILEEVEEFKDKQANLERKIEVITNLKNQQQGPVRVMDAISRGLPELLWLDRVQVKTNQIQITGRAFNVIAVTNFIENLDKVPEFKEPVVKTVNERGEVYQFTISVDYSLAPPAPEVEADPDATLDASTAAGS